MSPKDVSQIFNIAAASFAYQIASDKYHGEFGREV